MKLVEILDLCELNELSTLERCPVLIEPFLAARRYRDLSKFLPRWTEQPSDAKVTFQCNEVGGFSLNSTRMDRSAPNEKHPPRLS